MQFKSMIVVYDSQIAAGLPFSQVKKKIICNVYY